MADTPSVPSRPWIKPLLWSLAAILGTAIVCWRVPTAREVIGETALTVFQVLTTPFILELTVAFLGVCAVITINQWRLDRDKDEWVTLRVPDTSTTDAAKGEAHEGGTSGAAPVQR